MFRSPDEAGRGSRSKDDGPGRSDFSPSPRLEGLAAASAPGASPETALRVAEVNAAVRRIVEESFPSVWVLGEVSGWRRHPSGHRYFRLRDETAQLSCVMFRSDAVRLPTDPEEGMEVCALGHLTVYETRGQYQLVVRRIEARGEGLWRLAFERLRVKLAAEGLLDPSRKRSLPEVPGCIGVVTSRSGAALRDVLSVVRRRAPWTRVIVADCRVQGAEAVPEILGALGRLEAHGEAEVILLTRGGGSVEDLWAFNHEDVARAVAACGCPTVAGIGHEVDVTITDLVADRRAATPSAAAELMVPERVALVAELQAFAEALSGGLRQRVERTRRRLHEAARAMIGSTDRLLVESRGRVAIVGGRLDALSPLGTLRRGYAVPLDASRRVLRRGAMFERLESFDLRVIDAEVGCRVESVRSLEEGDAAEDDTGGRR